uniref:Uncharacterized protein n=1 Tax=Rousettus aegyptiacus TaxID=9407 RepID=A0A7J8B6Q8_ROUAE|nr:hypothetical protein HJG63_010459 [Rousettus aegyptiacus]
MCALQCSLYTRHTRTHHTHTHHACVRMCHTCTVYTPHMYMPHTCKRTMPAQAHTTHMCAHATHTHSAHAQVHTSHTHHITMQSVHAAYMHTPHRCAHRTHTTHMRTHTTLTQSLSPALSHAQLHAFWILSTLSSARLLWGGREVTAIQVDSGFSRDLGRGTGAGARALGRGGSPGPWASSPGGVVFKDRLQCEGFRKAGRTVAWHGSEEPAGAHHPRPQRRSKSLGRPGSCTPPAAP